MIKEDIGPNLEHHILAMLIQHHDSVHVNIEDLKPEYFADNELKYIFRMVQGMIRAGDGFDMVLGTSKILELIRAGAGPQTLDVFRALTTHYVGVVQNWRHYVAKLRMMYEERETYNILTNAVTEIGNNPLGVKDIRLRVEKDLSALVALGGMNDLAKREEVIEEVVDTAINRTAAPLRETGIYSFDTYLGGYRNQELWIIAARPSMGKTAVATTAFCAAAEQGMPVCFLSLDMGKQQFWHRVLSYHTGIDILKFERRYDWSEYEKEKLMAAKERLKKQPIYVDAWPYRNIYDIKSIVRSMRQRYGVETFFIDHIGKIQPEKAHSREREVGQMVESLKALTKEQDVFICGLAQMNRANELRREKEPLLSDLRDSGAIEQEADTVLLLHRPEYYKEDTFADGTPARGMMQIAIGKQRNGPRGVMKFEYVGANARINEYRPHAPFGPVPTDYNMQVRL